MGGLRICFAERPCFLLVTGYDTCPCSQAHQEPGPSGKMPEFFLSVVFFGNGTAGNGVDRLLQGCRESRRCSTDTYPESYITEYTELYEGNALRPAIQVILGPF